MQGLVNYRTNVRGGAAGFRKASSEAACVAPVYQLPALLRMLKHFRPNTQRPQNEAAQAIIASCLNSRGSHHDEERRTAGVFLRHADRRPDPLS
eukprot:12105237-Heterocapsa_arctica.AAC.1